MFIIIRMIFDTQDKTNEDCTSFTRQCRQTLIKHACHVFLSYLPPHTHSKQSEHNSRKYRFVLDQHAPSFLDRQSLYHTSYGSRVAKTYAWANVQSHLI